MKNEELLRAMGALDDDLLMESGQFSPRRIRPLRRLGSALVAVLLLSLLLFAASPGEDAGSITAQSITQTQAEATPVLGGATQAYITKQGGSVEDIFYSPLCDGDGLSLPVYTPAAVEDPEAYAEEQLGMWFERLLQLTGEPLSEPETRDVGEGGPFLYRVAEVSCGALQAELTVDNTQGVMQTVCVLSEVSGQPFAARLAPGCSDSELEQAAGPVLELLGGLRGKTFEVGRIKRGSDPGGGSQQVTLYAWEPSETISGQLYGMYLDCAEVVFCEENGALVLKTARHEKLEIEPAFSGPVPLVSVGQAEQWARQGWFFTGHWCPVCMGTQPPVDFSQYDGMEIVYRKDALARHIIPFYSLCRQLEPGTYAVSYVPAVQVSGMAEYFEQQSSVHEPS